MSLSSPARGHLVIFGCGYLGRALAQRAMGLGLKVTALTRNPATASDLRASGVDVIEGRLEENGWHGEVPASPEYVVNCVGSADRTEEGYRQSYLAGMASTLEWAKRGRPGTFVYTSSTGVYGAVSGEIDETTSPRPDSVRSRILLETEDLLRASAVAGRWFILRLAGLYGPGRHQLLDRILAGETVDLDDRRLNILHRDDAVDAVLACLGASAAISSQVFNVTCDESARRQEMIRWLRERAAGMRTDEGWAGAAAGTGRPRQRREVPERIIESRRLKDVLGWRPRHPSFREGYAAILEQWPRGGGG